MKTLRVLVPRYKLKFRLIGYKPLFIIRLFKHEIPPECNIYRQPQRLLSILFLLHTYIGNDELFSTLDRN